MDSKPLLYGLIGFFIGGFIVALAATTFDKPDNSASLASQSNSMSMDEMTVLLKDKKGDEFDELFISSMIEHHDGAIEMAELAATNAKHDEIKQLSQEIITAQNREISQMMRWQKDWDYKAVDTGDHSGH